MEPQGSKTMGEKGRELGSLLKNVPAAVESLRHVDAESVRAAIGAWGVWRKQVEEKVMEISKLAEEFEREGSLLPCEVKVATGAGDDIPIPPELVGRGDCTVQRVVKFVQDQVEAYEEALTTHMKEILGFSPTLVEMLGFSPTFEEKQMPAEVTLDLTELAGSKTESTFDAVFVVNVSWDVNIGGVCLMPVLTLEEVDANVALWAGRMLQSFNGREHNLNMKFVPSADGRPPKILASLSLHDIAIDADGDIVIDAGGDIAVPMCLQFKEKWNANDEAAMVKFFALEKSADGGAVNAVHSSIYPLIAPGRQREIDAISDKAGHGIVLLAKQKCKPGLDIKLTLRECDATASKFSTLVDLAQWDLTKEGGGSIRSIVLGETEVDIKGAMEELIASNNGLLVSSSGALDVHAQDMFALQDELETQIRSVPSAVTSLDLHSTAFSRDYLMAREDLKKWHANTVATLTRVLKDAEETAEKGQGWQYDLSITNVAGDRFPIRNPLIPGEESTFKQLLVGPLIEGVIEEVLAYEMRLLKYMRKHDIKKFLSFAPSFQETMVAEFTISCPSGRFAPRFMGKLDSKTVFEARVRVDVRWEEDNEKSPHMIFPQVHILDADAAVFRWAELLDRATHFPKKYLKYALHSQCVWMQFVKSVEDDKGPRIIASSNKEGIWNLERCPAELDLVVSMQFKEKWSAADEAAMARVFKILDRTGPVAWRDRVLPVGLSVPEVIYPVLDAARQHELDALAEKAGPAIVALAKTENRWSDLALFFRDSNASSEDLLSDPSTKLADLALKQWETEKCEMARDRPRRSVKHTPPTVFH